jgi:hypothetical protein
MILVCEPPYLIDIFVEFLAIEFHNICFYLDVNKLYIFSSKPFYIICLINFKDIILC